MDPKILAMSCTLAIATHGCLANSAADEEADCQAGNDGTPLYTLTGNPVAAPVPTVDSETSVFVQLLSGPTQSCTWSTGEADWFTGRQEPRGCTCSAPRSAAPFAVQEASCPDDSCVVVRIGAYVEMPWGGEREVQLVPKAAQYELRLQVIPESDPTTFVEQVYAGDAPG